VNLLIAFNLNEKPPRCYCTAATEHASVEDKKNSLANFSSRVTLSERAEVVRFCKTESQMAWKAPKIVEVPVGMEINMYACAARK
jgi:coenzyme PQQ precursor peptide PqqA